MGHQALTTDAQLVHQLADRFGQDILDSNGLIIRSKLAKVAFKTENGVHDLTKMTFPTLYRLACESMDELSLTHPVIVFDAAMIFEWGIEKDFDMIVAVIAPKDWLIKRAASKINIDEEQAEARLSSQISPAEKARRADRLIVNDGHIDLLKRRAEEFWPWIMRLIRDKLKTA